MPTFFDSTADAADAADAAEASEALRGLAHASRAFDRPAEMYGVIGDLSSGMRLLRQALDQIADVHERKAAHAFNDADDHEAGVRDALTVAKELRQAASLVDRAYDRLAEGFIAAGRIAWHPDPAVEEATCRGGSAWCSSRERRPTGRCASSTSWAMSMRWTSSRSGTTAMRPRRLRWRTGTSTTSPARAPTTGGALG